MHKTVEKVSAEMLEFAAKNPDKVHHLKIDWVETDLGPKPKIHLIFKNVECSNKGSKT